MVKLIPWKKWLKIFIFEWVIFDCGDHDDPKTQKFGIFLEIYFQKYMSGEH